MRTLVAVFIVIAVCSHAPAYPEPGEGPRVFHEPHWDQVCRNDRTPMWFRDPDQVLERMSVDGFIEVAVTWERSGALRTLHPTDHDLSEPLDAVLARIRDALHPQPAFVRTVFQRIRITGGEMAMLPGLHCLPHVRHDPGEPPRYPGTTQVMAGGLVPRAWADHALRVRLRVSPTGELLEVIPEQGNDELLPRV